MYSAKTDGFRVEVEPFFLESHSDRSENEYVWAYRVRIANEDGPPARLVSRHWEITDGNGRTETVDGPGVVGQMPLLPPGESFEYHSACPLGTPSGMMHGHYEMVRDDGTSFNIEVPGFSLDIPDAVPALN